MAVTEQERNEFIRKCIADGMSLSKVQDALSSELGIHITYMELRMLTSELSVSWEAQDKKLEAARPHSKPAAKAPAQQPAGAQGAGEEPQDEALPEDGGQEGAEGTEASAAGDGEADEETADAQAPGAGTTKVEISKLVRPGTAISGTVTFASGASGEWFVTQDGQLGLNPDEGSAKPTRDDLMKFQMELRRQLQGGM